MSREIAERCDLCGEYKTHADLVTVHGAGEAVDVCTTCQDKPIGALLEVALRLAGPPPAGLLT